MKRILITGANGFVCSNIIDVLLEQGWHVYAADRAFDNPAVIAWPREQVTFLTGDLESLPPLTVDALLHGAAITANAEQRGESPEDNFMANLNPALAMMRYAEANAIPRAIFISSSAVYHKTDPGLISEDEPASSFGLYPVAKHTIEELAGTLRNQYGRDVLCIRLGNLYGPHEIARETRPHTSLVQQLITQALAGVIHVNRQFLPREWTFVRDVGTAVNALLTTPELSYALYNVAASEVYTVDDIVQSIQAVLPDVTIVIEENNQPDNLTRLGTPDTSRLTADTGFGKWTAMEDGIRQTVATLPEEVNRA